jgi:hypothetical protein
MRPSLFIFLLLLLGLSCNLSSNAGKNTTTLAVDSLLHKPPLPDTLVFLDTVVEKLGRIRVYLNDSVLVFKDELVGKQVVLEDSSYFSKRLITGTPSVVWNIFDKNKWVQSNLTFTDSGLLLLSVNDEEGIPHIFALRLIDEKWHLLCRSDNSSCVLYSLTPMCIILYPKEERLLILYHGWGMDEEDGKSPIYYRTMGIYRFNKTDMDCLGYVRIPVRLGESDFWCTNEDNQKLFRLYQEIAHLSKFDDFYIDYY